MPVRSRRHQPSSLLDLPQDLRIEIAALFGVTSEQPLADLHSLRGTCSTMRRVCGHGDVGRRLSIEGIRDEISWVWDPTAYKAFLAMLTDLGNLEACFFFGIKAVFMENRGCNDLQRAAKGGHDAAAYLFAILLYRDNGGAATNDTAKRYMRRVAGGGSTTSRWLSNEECLPLREKAAHAIHSLTWRICGEPLPPPAQVHDDQFCIGNMIGAVPDLSVSGDSFDLVVVDPHDPTTTSETRSANAIAEPTPDGYQPFRHKISLITKINSCTQSKNEQESKTRNLNITRRWSLQYTNAALCGCSVVDKANF
jgi:hypothetical protein